MHLYIDRLCSNKYCLLSAPLYMLFKIPESNCSVHLCNLRLYPCYKKPSFWNDMMTFFSRDHTMCYFCWMLIYCILIPSTLCSDFNLMRQVIDTLGPEERPILEEGNLYVSSFDHKDRLKNQIKDDLLWKTTDLQWKKTSKY